MDRKLAHLQLVQTVIGRMAGNSFSIKGWSVTLVAALFALAAVDDINEAFVYLAYLPALMFWALDAHFLRQERLFRKLYDHVRLLAVEKIDFSMDTAAFDPTVASTSRIALSPTLRLFHGTLLGAIVVVMLIMLRH